MKKIHYIVASLLFIAFGSSAQNRIISIQSGVNLPYGQLAAHGEGGHSHEGEEGHDHSKDKENGYAGPGFQVGIQYAKTKLNGFGYAFQVNYSSFGLSNKKEWAGEIAEAFEVGELSLRIYNGYTSLGILAGPTYTFGTEKLQVDAQLLVGFNSLTTPKYDATPEFEAETRFTRNSSTVNGFAIQAGLNVRYALSEKWQLSAHVFNYFATGKSDYTYENLLNPSELIATKFQIPITFFGAGLGISYVIGK